MNLERFFYILFQPFVLRALAIGTLISVCAALLGVILVLKKYSMIGHGLADVGFAAMSLSLALGLNPMIISIPIIIIASFLIMLVSQKKGVSGDTAIGIAATASLALGILIAYSRSGFNVDVQNLMFGSILAVSNADLILSLVLSVVIITLYIVFYNRLFFVTYDEVYAKANGINTTIYHFLISFLTALTIIVGMKMMGSLLISGLIIFPAILARALTKSFKSMVLMSAIISVGCFIVGLSLSIVLNLPIGACIIAVNVVSIAAVAAFKKIASYI